MSRPALRGLGGPDPDDPDGRPSPLTGTVWQAWRATLRTSWKAASVAMVAGLLLEILLPVDVPWLPAVAALGFAALSLLLFFAGARMERRQPDRSLPEADESTLDRSALLERWSTPAQFGYAFGSGALFLLALSIGIGIGRLAGFAP